MRALFGAVDIGASSGRVIAGLVQDGTLKLAEVYRFENFPIKERDRLVWDFPRLISEVGHGLRELGARAEKLNLDVTSIGIDTWAVDFGLVADGELLENPLCYRDPSHDVGVRSIHRKLSFEELYKVNGLQFLPFNSIYQIERIRLLNPGLLSQAQQLLMMPDLIGYFLTGQTAAELTNASSTGLVNASTREWDQRLIDLLEIPFNLLPPLSDPGTEIGVLKPDFGPRLRSSKVVLVGSHDTASAVVGVPALQEDFAFLSSGTWSLLGTELKQPILTKKSRDANFTNEFGVDNTVRYLKNLSGLWLVSETLRDLQVQGARPNLKQLLADAALLNPKARIDVSDPALIEPGDMVTKIRRQLSDGSQAESEEPAELIAIILHSLAESYAENLKILEELVGRTFTTLHVVGGGSQNEVLNRLTAHYCQVEVVAGPVEATSIGNLLVQIRAAGLVPGSLMDLRAVIRESDLVN
ncbi:MAG: rhamnulokinase [Candidatus Aquiluna sp.]|nr:rhamnulokinase [Aquiluna sp.]